MDQVIPSQAIRSFIVIDDDPDIRDTLGRVLGRGGHSVVCFPSVETAVPYVLKTKVDLIFLDICMPSIDGVTLLAHLRKKGVRAPVVVISGTATKGDVTRIYDLNATFLRKPFSVKEVRQALAALDDNAATPADSRKPCPSDIAGGEQAEERFQHALDGLRNEGFPKISSRVSSIRKILRDSQASDVELRELMSLDALVASRVVAKANSPLFGGDASVRSLDGAVARLGHAEVARLAIETLLQPAFKLTNSDLRVEVDERWNRTVRTAHAAYRIATSLGMEANELYLMTLAHHVGEFMVIAVVDAIRDPRETAKLDTHIRTRHEALGAELLRSWGMPEAWSHLAGSHHNPAPSGVEAVVQLARSATTKDADRDLKHESYLCEALGMSITDYRRIRDLVTVVH